MPKVSEYFGLGVTQPLLDFVDTHSARDLLLFVDPFAISLRNDTWSNLCLDHINSFFQQAIDLIHSGNEIAARAILSNLKEPKETGLGYGTKPRRGRGVSGGKAFDLYAALRKSRAAATGLLTDLGEFDLFIEGLGPDGLSDISTNIIKSPLIAYTQAECRLWGIPTRKVAVPRVWDIVRRVWVTDYYDLPVLDGHPLILVPKFSVRREMTLTSQEYYNEYILDYLEREEIRRGTGLVTVLKDGTKKVTKKALKEKYKFSKDFLARFTEATPEALEKYKNFYRNLPGGIGAVSDGDLLINFGEFFDERAFAAALVGQLAEILPGPDDATRYHRFMVGVLEFLFYPNLIYPELEREVHEGRKRIDILYTNAAATGTFSRAQSSPMLASQLIPVECKNYSKDLKNPELDQIAGRFSRERGWLGLLCCRKLEDKVRLIAGCRDTAADGRGCILLFDDEDIIRMLELIAAGRRAAVDEYVDQRLRAVIG